ncbi:unnamed protein product [Mytilus edulis]|uniref:Reverse transcriptase domain-containing protein n=1 Tax=Mytilus edulis TaxID=6550 RepID=A0A8S3Q7S5_MYTED|nr:unnamed protein product [Mytilus edulis]
MVECNLKTNSKGLTFINVNGIDTSEIDYFLYTDPKCEPSKRLIDLPSNVSDHHPISMRIKCNITREQQSRNSEKQKHKIRWNKVDKSRYEETISRNIGDFIERISEHYATRYVDLDTIEKAIKSINKGKAEDVFGISIENVLYAGQQFKLFLHKLINRMFQDRVLPDIIKTGLLSPVFKNKGDKNDAKYYRGITVLPILLKIIEFILRIDLRSGSLKLQSILQKGFTANTSPLNAAIILEEVYREYMDKNYLSI